MMKLSVSILLILLLIHSLSPISLKNRNGLSGDDKYKNMLLKLNSTIFDNSKFINASYNNLSYIVDTFGPRLWGSKSLEMVISYLESKVKLDGFEKVRLEKVPNVPQWVRGIEHLTLYSPRPFPSKLSLIGLGGTIGGNITAEALVVKDENELRLMRNQVKGKIVIFNNKWVNYPTSVKYRSDGADLVSKYGGIGVLVRSVTPSSIGSPHTGLVIYSGKYKKIPAAAITVEDADMLTRMQKRGQKIVLNLYLGAKYLENVTSHNLVAEFVGYKYPDQIVLLGGHLDSWDTGSQTGALDDGAGFMVCLEAVRVLIKLGLRPKRTIRLVGWSGEEFSLKNVSGSYQYAIKHRKELGKHIIALESDSGVTDLRGFAFNGSEKGRKFLKKLVSNYFSGFGISKVEGDAIGVDVQPLHEIGVPQIAPIIVDSKDSKHYFTYHHSAGDSMNAISPYEMSRNVFGISGIIFLLADLDENFPR